MLGVLTSFLGLFLLASGADEGPARPEDAWAAALDRYTVIAEEAEQTGLPEAKRKEARGILSRFRVMISSPAYETPPFVHPERPLDRSPRRMARFVLILLGDMADMRSRLETDPPAGAEAVRLKQRYMRDREDAGLLLDEMAALRRAKRSSVFLEEKKPRERKLKSARPAPKIDEELLRCRKPFVMEGYFQAEFPCWAWHFRSGERSEGMKDPRPSGNVGPRGLWLDEVRLPGKRSASYGFKWKPKGRRHALMFARDTQAAPEAAGTAARESEREVVIYPELEGTDFQIRGFDMRQDSGLDCKTKPEGAWSAALNAEYWPVDASCRAWLSRWTPRLPGRVDGRLAPAGGPEAGGEGSLFETPYELKYNLNTKPCGGFGRSMPQRVRVLCAKGGKGLYVFTLDATEDVFDQFLPLLESVRRSFALSEEPAP